MARKKTNSSLSPGMDDDGASGSLQQEDTDIPTLDTTRLRQVIHQKLNELKHGDLFMDGLDEGSYGKLLSDGEVYGKFMDILGESLMKIETANEEGLNGGKLKRKRKGFIKAVWSQNDAIAREIDFYLTSKPPKSEIPPPKKEEKAETHPLEKPADFGSFDEDKEDSSTTSQNTSRLSKSSSHRRYKKKLKEHKKKRHHKEKKKTRRVESRKHKHSDKSDDDDSQSNDSLLDQEEEDESLDDQDDKRDVLSFKSKAEAKASFEREKAGILELCDDNVKNDFRQLGFSRWAKDVLPILQLSPYDIPPGGVRDDWMRMMKSCRKSKRPMTRLVFWYGVTEENLKEAYSFIQSSKIISYAHGCKNGYNQIPSKLQKKVDLEKKLTKSEEQHIRGLEEQKADAKLPPEDRIKWMRIFEEEHELMTDSTEEADSVERAKVKKRKKTPENETDEKLKKNKSKKHSIEETVVKKPKKARVVEDVVDKGDTRKKSLFEIDTEAKKTSSTNGDATGKTVKMAKIVADEIMLQILKNGKSANNDIVESKGADIFLKGNSFDGLSEEIPTGKTKEKGKKRQKLVDNDEEIAMEVEQEDLLNADDIPTEDEQDDDDFSGHEESDSDELVKCDEGVDKRRQDRKDFAKRLKAKKRKEITEEDKKSAREVVLAKRRRKDWERKEQKRKRECEENNLPYEPREFKERGSGKPSKKKSAVMSSHEAEQERFEQCEKVFNPVRACLRASVDNGDATIAKECLEFLQSHVDTITPSFIREYGIGILIKDTRKAFEQNYVDVKRLCKIVTNDMKRVFNEKEKDVPADFKPTLARQQKSSVERMTPPNKDFDTLPDAATEKKTAAFIKKEETPTSADQFDLPISTKRVSSVVKEEQGQPSSVSSVSKKGSNSALDQGKRIEILRTLTKQEPPKPAKTVFSLNKLFEEKPKKIPILATEKRADLVLTPTPAKALAPAWLTALPPVDESYDDDDDRKLATEFLSDAASHFPADRVNSTCLALALEAAIFEWSRSQPLLHCRKKNVDTYWEKIHDITAAIAGKRQTGSLVRKIVDGCYATPMDVAKLSRKTLFQSFDVSSNHL